MTTLLRIDEEYKRLIRPLTRKEFDELKADIKRDKKIYVPIITSKNGTVLDGHHRLIIAKEVGITEKDIPIEVVDFADPLEEKLFVIRCNKNRRHLDLADRAFLANEELKILTEINKKKQIAEAGIRATTDKGKRKNLIEQSLSKSTLSSQVDNTRKTKPRKTTDPQTRKNRRQKTSSYKAGRSQGLSDKTLERYQYLEKHSPELFKKVNNKDIEIGKAFNQLKAQEKKQELEQKAAAIKLDSESSQFKLIQKDFRDGFDDFKANSVDLIFTDPPYPKGDLPIYADLAKFATKVLKPGGSLVTNLGEHNLPEVLQLILGNSDSQLKFWWRIVVGHTGRQISRFHDRRVIVFCKLLLWFVKGERPTLVNDLEDYIESKPPNKDLSEWAQSHVEAEHVISHLTVKNQIVVDPFTGSGNTGIASLKLDRKFVGYEINVEMHKIAANNLTQFVNNQA